MQVWIDSTGKKDQEVGIYYPLAAAERSSFGTRNTEMQGDSTMRPARTSQFQKPDTKMLKARFDRQPKEMKLVGFKSPIGGLTFVQNNYGIAVALDWDSTGSMNYEAVIPFRTFYKNNLTESDSTKTFTVSIIVPGLAAPGVSGEEGEHGGDMGGGMHGGGMGGDMHGGGMHGSGGYGGNSSAYSTLYVKNTIKMRIRLKNK